MDFYDKKYDKIEESSDKGKRGFPDYEKKGNFLHCKKLPANKN